MSDPLEKIADALDTSKQLRRIEAEVAQLHAVVSASLAEQQRLNNRMDQTVCQLTEGLRDTRERLCTVEAAVKQIPQLHKDVDELKTKLAKYVGLGAGAAVVISALFNWAIKVLG